jgi:hypothetical protein
MKNKKETLDPDFKFKLIDPEAIISIDMNTNFYIRLKTIAMSMVKDKSKQEMENANAQIKNNKVTEEWVEHLETLYILINDFDKEAIRLNKIVEKTKEEMEELMKKSIDL